MTTLRFFGRNLLVGIEPLDSWGAIVGPGGGIEGFFTGEHGGPIVQVVDDEHVFTLPVGTRATGLAATFTLSLAANVRTGQALNVSLYQSPQPVMRRLPISLVFREVLTVTMSPTFTSRSRPGDQVSVETSFSLLVTEPDVLFCWVFWFAERQTTVRQDVLGNGSVTLFLE